MVRDSITVKLEQFEKHMQDLEHVMSNQYSREQTDIFEHRCQKGLDDLIFSCRQSYGANRRIVQEVLSIFAKSQLAGIALLTTRLMNRFFDKFSLLCLYESKSYGVPDTDQTDYFALYKSILQNFPHHADMLQMSEYAVMGLSDQQVSGLFALCIEAIQESSENHNWTESDVFTTSMALLMARCIVKRNKDYETFYLLMAHVVASLSISHFYQPARDYAESAIMMSMDDGCPQLGFLVACRAYTSNNDAIGGLFFYNLAMDELHAKPECNKKFFFEMLWLQLMTLRTANIYDLVYLNSFSTFFDEQEFNDYDTDSFHHSLFSFRLKFRDKNLPKDIESYLTKRMQIIEEQGYHGAIPWYLTLIQLLNAYPVTDTKLLNKYIDKFDKLIPDKNVIGNQLDLIFRRDLDRLLKGEYIKLCATRDVENFNTDSWQATVMAKRLLDMAFTQKKHADFMLAMAFRSDFGFVFPNNQCPGFSAPVNVSTYTADDVHTIYEDVDGLQSAIQLIDMDEMLWLGHGEQSIYSFSLIKNEYRFVDLGKWDWNILNKRKFTYEFTNQTKDLHGNPIIKCNEDYADEYKAEYAKMSDYLIEVEDQGNCLCIVKDKDLAHVPHHLLIDKDTHKFLGELKPSANVLSTEVMVGTLFDEMLNRNYTSTFWCPIGEKPGAEDYALQMQYSKIHELMENRHITEYLTTYPESPLSCDVNIACAHGSQNIGNELYFYAKDEPIREIDRIIGHGKLLILLTCHSGSMRDGTTTYDASIHTLIKRYIRAGYASVVAPMWSLSVDITNDWLCMFFETIDRGAYIYQAVYDANMYVKSKIESPYAWACMHLFGNPYLKVVDMDN